MSKWMFSLTGALVLGVGMSLSGTAKAAFQCDICRMEYQACLATAADLAERSKCMSEMSECVGMWCRYDPTSVGDKARLVPEKSGYDMSPKRFANESLLSQR